MRGFRAVLGLIAGSAVALAATAASADGPSYRGSIRDGSYSPFSWSGFYVGGHVGGAWADVDWTLTQPAVPGGEPISHNDGGGFIGGGHIGFQHQWGNVVAGIEVSFSGLDVEDTVTSDAVPGASRRAEIDNLFLASLRLGYAWDRSLLYVKGGYASAAVTLETTITATGAVTSHTRERENGWSIGGGWDYAMTPNIILGLEYNFVHLNVDDRAGVGSGIPFTVSDADADIHTVMARLSFKFGRDEPVVRPMK